MISNAKKGQQILSWLSLELKYLYSHNSRKQIWYGVAISEH